jgi:hypothetical protein
MTPDEIDRLEGRATHNRPGERGFEYIAAAICRAYLKRSLTR